MHTWSIMPSRSKKKGVSSKGKNPEKNTLNPFEVRVNRRKYDVLGQKRKSDSGLPGVSRSKAIQKRKKTLLVEYRQKNKSNRLVDRRFGEGDEDLSVEDKMMRRFILERKRKHERSNLFNLNEEEDQLTHFGQSVGDIERFDDVLISDEEGQEEEDIGETHFGGFMKKKKQPHHENEEAEESPAKTRKQILDEIVAKFKAQKYERQSERMEVEDLMDKVDNEWKSVHTLLPKVVEGQSSNTADDYDRSVRELQFERRGQALDKLKTGEVLAREERNKLEAAEGVFPVPQTLSEWSGLVEGCGPAECQLTVERIYTYSHPVLSPTNKQQLQEFLGILIAYFMKLGGDPLSSNTLATLDKLVGPLHKLAQLSADHTSSLFQKVLSSEYEKWSQRRKELPSFSTLVVFQLAGLVFSAPGGHHPIITPALLFITKILAQCRVNSLSDLLLGLVLCSTAMEYVRSSKRFVPELVNFLSSSVGYFSRSKQCVLLPPFSTRSKLRRKLAVAPEGEDDLTGASLLGLLSSCSSSSEPSTCDVLKVIIDMNSQLLQLYKDLPSFPEVFSLLTTNLSSLETTGWPAPLIDSVQMIQSSYAKLSAQPRGVLQLLKQKPSSIKFYEPRFDEVYEVDRRKPRAKSSKTREQQKLKYKLKKETKGAVREIRKDAAFLANVQLEETLLLDAERQKKTRRLMHELQTQQHEAKKF